MQGFSADTTVTMKENTVSKVLYDNLVSTGDNYTWDFTSSAINVESSITVLKKSYSIADTSYGDTTTYIFNDLSNFIKYDYSRADGFGTLVLPDTTFINAVRIHTRYYYTDNSLHSRSIVYDYNTYDWYIDSYNAPIASIQYKKKTTNDYDPFIGGVFVTESSYVRYLPVKEPVVTAVSSVFKQKKLVCSPNPTNGVVKISSSSGGEIIVVSNVKGEIINEISMNRGVHELDVSNYPKGLYFFTLKTHSGIAIEKVVVN